MLNSNHPRIAVAGQNAALRERSPLGARRRTYPLRSDSAVCATRSPAPRPPNTLLAGAPSRWLRPLWG